MKRLLLIVLLFLTGVKAQAQTYEEIWAMGGILSIGYKHVATSLPDVSFNTFSIELAQHNFWNNIDFNSSFQYGSRNGLKYMTLEPFSLAGMVILRFIMFGDGAQFDGTYAAVLGCFFAVSSMGFNIGVGDAFSIRPYWSLLRLSRVYNSGYAWRSLNGAIGTNLTYTRGRLMVSPYVEYAFDYGFDYKSWRNNDRGLFKGWDFGLSLGLKLF